MKFAVIESDNWYNDEYLIKYVESIEEFKSLVCSKYAEAQILEGVSFDDVKRNYCFGEGVFLIFSENKVSLVEKSAELRKGYIYNGTKNVTKLIKSWKMIECKVNDKEDPDWVSSIKEWKPSQLKEYSSNLIIGKRGTGKSTIILDLIKNIGSKDPELLSNILVVSPKEQYNSFYTKNLMNGKILYDLNQEGLRNYLDTKPGIIVFDDCFDSKGTWTENKILTDILFNNRHYNKYVFVSLQFPLSMKPELRHNLDNVILLSESFLFNQKRLYDHYAEFFPCLEDFKNCLNNLTENFSSMVIENKSLKPDIEQKVHWYKAKC